MKYRKNGFTIVELLIVIVVIAILAAITIIAFLGLRTKADTTTRLSELKSWQQIYQLYAVTYGTYPYYPGAPDGDSTGANTGYCLGTGYPDMDGSGLGNCRDLGGGQTQFHVNTALNTELKKVATFPSGPRTSPGANALGPFARFYIGGNVVLSNVFAGATCPTGTTNSYTYPGNAASICDINLPPVN